jgi:hypothetical protein
MTMTAYSTMHTRLRVRRGLASAHQCVTCADRGLPGPALDWARIHERDGESVWDYVPLCRRCHIAYDGSGHRQPHSEAAKATLSLKNRQYRHTPEAVEKIRRASREHMTPEAREHLSEAMRKSWRRRKGGDAGR